MFFSPGKVSPLLSAWSSSWGITADEGQHLTSVHQIKTFVKQNEIIHGLTELCALGTHLMHLSCSIALGSKADHGQRRGDAQRWEEHFTCLAGLCDLEEFKGELSVCSDQWLVLWCHGSLGSEWKELCAFRLKYPKWPPPPSGMYQLD